MRAHTLGCWKAATFFLSFFLVHSTFVPRLAAADWTPPTSEENGDSSPAHCDGRLVTGIKCEGRYCDNVSLQCDDAQNLETKEWSPYFSEESRDGYTCPQDQYVQALRCQGRYCDGVSVQCARALDLDVDPKACYWKASVSEENGGAVEFGKGTHLKGLRCHGKYCDRLESYVCPSKAKVCDSEECKIEQAKRFAPVLKFDQKQAEANKCFPSDAAQYWDARNSGDKGRICNESADSLLGGQIPIYYAYEDCSADSTVIMYWFFYGFQDTCSPGLGSHNADWERVAVKIKDGRLERVLYFQHSGSYTRQGRDLEILNDTHPIAYVGKNSHGSYHDTGGSGSCLYFEDYRNPDSKQYTLHSEDNLVALKDSKASPPWMTASDSTNFDGIPGPLRRGINLCSLPGCEGKDVKIGAALCFGECGCSKSSIGDSPF